VSLLRRTSALAVSALAAVALGACGHKLSNPTTADTEGSYVRAGDLSYQVQLSRELNPYAAEDREYFAGTSAGRATPDQMWFAVFLLAKNETNRTLITSNSFDIVDTQGNKYYPVAINRAVNPFAWTSRVLRPAGTEPAPDSIASFGPTQGSELLFKLSNNVYSNRPLTFEIHAPGQAQPSAISLDL
jgi:hypothetical protein